MELLQGRIKRWGTGGIPSPTWRHAMEASSLVGKNSGGIILSCILPLAFVVFPESLSVSHSF